METGNQTTVYTIVYTAADADRGKFHNPEARGSYLSLASAQKELERQIAEERGEDFWEMYQDGYAAAGFSRIEIVSAMLHWERSS